MWSSSPYDAAPPFICGPVVRLGVSFTSPTLAGTPRTSTGKPPVFAHSRREKHVKRGSVLEGVLGRARDALVDRSGTLHGDLDPFERRTDAVGELLVVPLRAADERCHHLRPHGERRELPPAGDAGAGVRRGQLVAPRGAALSGLPGEGPARLVAHHLRGGGPDRPAAPV